MITSCAFPPTLSQRVKDPRANHYSTTTAGNGWSGGIYDASPLPMPTGVINAATTSLWEYLLLLFIFPRKDGDPVDRDIVYHAPTIYNMLT